MQKTGPEFKATKAGCLSVVMPVYNEEGTVMEIVRRVLEQPVVRELIIVDDCSSDGTRSILEKLAAADRRIRLFHHPVNQGKGTALRTGFRKALADVVIIQDADLEYDPVEWQIAGPYLKQRRDVVFGSRFLDSEAHRGLYYWHSVANYHLTLLSNMVTNLNLTDMETGFKAFRREVIRKIDLKENRFGFEPEITIKIARSHPRLRTYEVSISYYGRTYEEGKKIGWRDAVRAFPVIFKYGIFR